MALNEMIAQGAQFKMPDPLEQYGRIAQIQQAQNQNALAQYQINSAKRADETNTNFLSSLRAAGDDPAKVRQALMMAGKVKEAGELDASALTRQKTQGEIQEQQRKNVDRMNLDLSNNPSDENIKAYMQDIDADTTFSPAAKASAKRGLGEMLGLSVDERRKSFATAGMTGAERATAAKPQVVSPGASLMAPGSTTPLYTQPTKNIGAISPNDFTPASIQKFNNSGKYSDLVRVPAVVAAGGAGGAGGAAGTGTVEVVDPKDPTKTIIVAKQTAVDNRMTPAKAMEGLTPVQRQKLEASYPVATTALKGHQNKTAQFIKDLEELRDHPGLDSITGFVAGNFRGVSGPGRAAVAKYDKVVAKGGFQTLQEMRDMSKTGGALGNISDKENEQLKKSFAAIDRKQDAADVRTAIDDLIKELQGGVGRLQDAYDLTYEYRTGRTAPAVNQYVEMKTLPDGRKLGKKADGTVEEIK